MFVVTLKHSIFFPDVSFCVVCLLLLLWVAALLKDKQLFSPAELKMNTLDEVLRDPDGFAAFYDFLITQCSAENAVFWKEVELYRDDASTALQLCHDIITAHHHAAVHSSDADADHLLLCATCERVKLQCQTNIVARAKV